MDPSSFPKQYGGELDWQWGDMPNLDEPARERLRNLEQPLAEGQTKKEILKGPMLFKGDQVEVLGTEGGKERRITVPVPQTEQQQKLETETNGAATEPLNGDGESKLASTTDVTDNEKTGIENVAVDQVTNHETTTAAA